MRAFSYLLTALAALALGVAAQARTTSLDQWQFSRDGASWETVTVPHSTNAEDGRSAAYYRGQTHYRRTFRANPARPAFLQFEGAAQAASVYVNGTLARTHKGGYTPFIVPLTDMLQRGENLVEVVCDNSVDLEMIPISSDFNKNNGLHNPVSLLTFGRQYLCPAAYGPDRLHLTQTAVSAERAVARLEARIVNAAPRAKTVRATVLLRDAAGRVVWRERQRLTVPAGEGAPICADIALDRPHLWDGVRDPYLYTVEVRIRGDVARAQVGFRFFSLDRDNGFMLNGKPYPLRGVSMHQDLEGRASALTREDIERDYEIVRELGCNFLRLAHYPHNEYAFRLCDRMGIIVQTEIPWVNICGEQATEAYFDNIHEQMREMVTSLYNHASICFWGMWNELDSWGNTPVYQGRLDARRAVDETARLYAYAKSLDPTRAVGLTDDSVFARDFYTELKADYFTPAFGDMVRA